MRLHWVLLCCPPSAQLHLRRHGNAIETRAVPLCVAQGFNASVQNSDSIRKYLKYCTYCIDFGCGQLFKILVPHANATCISLPREQCFHQQRCLRWQRGALHLFGWLKKWQQAGSHEAAAEEENVAREEAPTEAPSEPEEGAAATSFEPLADGRILSFGFCGCVEAAEPPPPLWRTVAVERVSEAELRPPAAGRSHGRSSHSGGARGRPGKSPRARRLAQHADETEEAAGHYRCCCGCGCYCCCCCFP